jgi:hypothetical protein
MASLTREINHQVAEMITMVKNEGEWDGNDCTNYLSIVLPNYWEAYDICHTLWKVIMIEIESEIENYGLPWTVGFEGVLDKDELRRIGDDDNYIAYEFNITKH